jgi:hypothetical protein
VDAREPTVVADFDEHRVGEGIYSPEDDSKRIEVTNWPFDVRKELIEPRLGELVAVRRSLRDESQFLDCYVDEFRWMHTNVRCVSKRQLERLDLRTERVQRNSNAAHDEIARSPGPRCRIVTTVFESIEFSKRAPDSFE